MLNVNKQYRIPLATTGLVVAIATYHEVRIFNSWNAAFDVSNDGGQGDYSVTLTGALFNDDYWYVDWLLTVPLLLTKLILVMASPIGKIITMVGDLEPKIIGADEEARKVYAELTEPEGKRQDGRDREALSQD